MRMFKIVAIVSMIHLLAPDVIANESIGSFQALPTNQEQIKMVLNSEWDKWEIDQFEEIEWTPFLLEEVEARSKMIQGYVDFNKVNDSQQFDPLEEDGGGKVGNGGKVLICNNKTYVTDYIWGIDAYGFEPQFFAGKNEFEKAASIIHRLREKDPYRYKKYMIDLLKFKSESVFLSNYKMGLTNDISVPGIPSDCIRRLVVNQVVPTMIGEYRYRINTELAKMMDLDTRAGIIVHEIIYKEAIELGHANDRSVMYLNSYLASKQFDIDSRSEYQLKLLNAGFSYFLSGIKLQMGSIQIDDDNNIILGQVKEDTCIDLNNNHYCFVKKSDVTFYENGQIKTGWISSDEKNVYRTSDQESIFFLGAKNYSGSIAIFHLTGFPHILEVCSGEVIIENKTYKIVENSMVTFYNDGNVESFFLKDSIRVNSETVRGKISSRSEVTLYPNGKLKSFQIGGASKIDSKLYFRGFFELDQDGNVITILK